MHMLYQKAGHFLIVINFYSLNGSVGDWLTNANIDSHKNIIYSHRYDMTCKLRFGFGDALLNLFEPELFVAFTPEVFDDWEANLLPMMPLRESFHSSNNTPSTLVSTAPSLVLSSRSSQSEIRRLNPLVEHLSVQLAQAHRQLSEAHQRIRELESENAKLLRKRNRSVESDFGLYRARFLAKSDIAQDLNSLASSVREKQYLFAV